jgi:hypothetical protein
MISWQVANVSCVIEELLILVLVTVIRVCTSKHAVGVYCCTIIVLFAILVSIWVLLPSQEVVVHLSSWVNATIVFWILLSTHIFVIVLV